MADSLELLRNSMVTTVAETVTESGNSGSFSTRGFNSASSTINVSSISGSGATITFSVEESDDGTIWNIITSPVSFTSSSNTRIQGTRISSRYFRISWAVSGSTPSVTFVVTSTLKNDSSNVHKSFKTQTDTFTDPGVGTTVNTANIPFSNFSLSVRATGAVLDWQVNLEGSLDGINFSTIVKHTGATGSGNTVFPGTNVSPCLYFRLRCMAITLGDGTNIIATALGSQ